MKKYFNYFLVIIVLFIAISLPTIWRVRFGSTVTSTNTTDTLETFRTNVNASLSSLQNDRVSTTTAQTWTEAQSYLATTTIGSLASTTIGFNGRIGVGSTTPMADLSFGTSTATSTVASGRFCAFLIDEAGRGMWVKLAISGNEVFSTSTNSCQ